MKTLRQDQNAKLADFEEMEKYRVGFEKTSGLIEAERERNNQGRFHFLSHNPLLIPYDSYDMSHTLLQFQRIPLERILIRESRSELGGKLKTGEAET